MIDNRIHLSLDVEIIVVEVDVLLCSANKEIGLTCIQDNVCPELTHL